MTRPSLAPDQWCRMIRDLTALTCCLTTLAALVLTFARPAAPAPMLPSPVPIMTTVDAPPFDLGAFEPTDVLWLPELTADAA